MTPGTKLVLFEIARRAISVVVFVLVLLGAHALVHRLTGTANALPALAIACVLTICTFKLFPRVLAKTGLLPAPDHLSLANTDLRHRLVPESISIDSLKLNIPNLEILEKTDELVRYKNAEGDIIELGFCPQASQCPYDLSQVEQLKHIFAEANRKQGSTLLTFPFKNYGGLPCMEAVSETLQKPHGVVCKASITAPRKSFYFYVSFYGAEHGITGLRDAIVFSKLSEQVGWEAAKGTGSRADSESNKEKYDAEFPNHPLSRVRSNLRLLANKIEFDDAVLQSEPYAPPSVHTDRL